MGLNHVQTYVPWNFHELQRDYYDFSGPRDVGAFLDLVNELGMTAFVRPGPYICGASAPCRAFTSTPAA